MSATRMTSRIKLNAGAIARRVAELRGKRGWYQSGLAERAGVAKSVIGHIETGRRVPSLRSAVGLSVVFRCSLEWILFGLPGNAKLWRLSKMNGASDAGSAVENVPMTGSATDRPGTVILD